jgi:hypothetical protein
MLLDQEKLLRELARLREQLEPHFNPDTAAPGFPRTTASAGHCAAVATILAESLQGTLVSARVGGISHWFNRFRVGSPSGDLELDADITGDQFGFQKVRLAEAGQLYEGTRERVPSELDDGTRKRADLLARRAGLT